MHFLTACLFFSAFVFSSIFLHLRIFSYIIYS
nr:MAG TPA: hypothetical protein [Caudoviricetes sp.]